MQNQCFATAVLTHTHKLWMLHLKDAFLLHRACVVLRKDDLAFSFRTFSLNPDLEKTRIKMKKSLKKLSLT